MSDRHDDREPSEAAKDLMSAVTGVGGRALTYEFPLMVCVVAGVTPAGEFWSDVTFAPATPGMKEVGDRASEAVYGIMKAAAKRGARLRAEQEYAGSDEEPN